MELGERVIRLNSAPVNPGGEFVLYWMSAFRRAHWNFALDRAAAWAAELKKPLMVLEALRCDYPWASDRLHRFVLEGMRDNAAQFKESQVTYYPFAETFRGEGKGLIEALASRCCLIVGDDYPAFFLPRMLKAAAAKSAVRMEAVDSNGLLPLREAEKVFKTAFSFRRFLQKKLPLLLHQFPQKDPLAKLRIPAPVRIPADIAERWPPASKELLDASVEALSGIPIDHSVRPAPLRGGHRAASERLEDFLQSDLHRYDEDRNHPDENATSRLSPYLHFGHISAHEVFQRVAGVEDWTMDRIGGGARGQREGWWGMSPGAEAFLDQLVTWRELGFNMCSKVEDYDKFESLPDWARKELSDHSVDTRQFRYNLREFEAAKTHDPLWNAAQRQLLQEGFIHNYLRMLWGKKILEWSATPREALDIMTELNNKYGLDGRDPNSYTGIMWVLGRYDRPFGPSRPIFGKIRYMSSAATLRKVKVKNYLVRYGD